jgi:cyclopropane fatty-acyl-phospholipid synthase-like methyltransferase
VTATIGTKRDWHAHWSAVGDRVGPREFLRQVERTVGGQPRDDISLALDAVSAALDLRASDCLLDLCCGNGLLTVRLAAGCRWTYGVDFSQYLIEVARSYHTGPTIKYIHSSVTELTASQLDGRRPNKVSMTGAVQYLTEGQLEQLLKMLRNVTAGAADLFFADVPDVSRLPHFYDTAERRAEFERRARAGTEAIGTWWSRQDLAQRFEAYGYVTEFREADPRRLGAHYRFDLFARPLHKSSPA